MTLQPAQLSRNDGVHGSDRAEMVEALATALAIESDSSLQAQLRKLERVPDGERFMAPRPHWHLHLGFLIPCGR
jgi:hypothetical protein